MFDQLDMHTIVGSHDVIMITLDTLRFDAAQQAFTQGSLPVLSRWLPASGFACRHTPGSFTFAAHQAFLTGFLPTPIAPNANGKPHPRLFVLAFPGSESSNAQSYVFAHGANLPEAFVSLGYRSICLGGVGFFNKQNPLGSVLPNMFQESYWRPEFGVSYHASTDAQVALAKQLLAQYTERVFMLLNVSAIHQPNVHYLSNANSPDHIATGVFATHTLATDSLASHQAALCYVDQALAPLLDALAKRGPAFVIICSDHGTAYGEDGYHGHRHAHPVVMQVPYAHFVVPRQ